MLKDEFQIIATNKIRNIIIYVCYFYRGLEGNITNLDFAPINISQHNGSYGNLVNQTFGLNDTTQEDHPYMLSAEEWLMVDSNRYVIAADRARVYGSAVLIPSGIILNFLSFIIFYKLKKYKSAPGSHIMCMAIADNCALLGILVVESYNFSKPQRKPCIADLNIVLCKLGTIFLNAGPLWSGVLLASATVEIYCCIAFPLKIKSWNLTKISKFLNIIYFFASFGLNIPVGYEIYLEKENNETICVFPFGGITELSDHIVNGILSHIIVTMVILIFTVAIAVHLKKMKNNRKSPSQNMVIRSSKEFVITTMLFVVACLFLVTRLPIVIVFEITRYFDYTGDVDVKPWQLLKASLSSAALLLVINHSTNFVIYMIFFKEFRDKFVAMVTCKQNNNDMALRRSSTRISMVTSLRTQPPREIASIL